MTVDDPDSITPTIVVNVKRRIGGVSPKEKAEWLRTLDTRVTPQINDAFRRASTGYLEWDDDKWDIAIRWVVGPVSNDLLYGPCRSCHHSLPHHKGEEGGRPCDLCGCSPFRPSVKAEQRERLRMPFLALSKAIDTGEADNPYLKALAFAFMAVFREMIDDGMDWMGVKRSDTVPPEEALDEPGLPALPSGS